MNTNLEVSGPHKDFESIKHVDESGIEYWRGRDLFPLFGYSTWQSFEELISRASKAALNSGQNVGNHFSRLTKMVEVGSNAKRSVRDWKLDRYACYLVAQNGDPAISQIALAQSYFAIQTRKQELLQDLSDAEKRVAIRDEVTKENKKLFSTAKAAGVSNFGSFNDEGYRGLYGMPLSSIESKKGVKKGQLLDHSGSTELAANLFRITQTEDKIRKENIHGQGPTSQTHFMVGGKVRQTIKDIGGTLPENLKPEKHIKEAKKDIKIAKKNNSNTLLD